KVAKLDVSSAFTGVDKTFTDLTGWTAAPGGGTAAISSGTLHLANSSGDTSGVSQPYGPAGGFVATLNGVVTDYSASGTSLVMEVANGTRRLMLSVRADGVYSYVSGTSGWSQVYATTNDTSTAHLWKAVVAADGTATLYEDGAETGASWTV